MHCCKVLQNLHQLFDWQYIEQIIGGDFAKFCGLLRIYELYKDQIFKIFFVYELPNLDCNKKSQSPPHSAARRKAKLDFSSRSCLLPGVARCMPVATERRARSAVRPYQMKTTILHHFDSFCLPLHRIYKPCVPQFEVRHSELANRDLVATDLASAARKIRFVIKALQRLTSQKHIQYSQKDAFGF